ncbi:hypothetical protein K380107A5_19370 [Holdemania massiliensis]|uniref:Coenzyme F420 hydrogenase/dehydrogenase, beta subunit C-terminal domain n=1 Tax=Holdemania massiliensis TaxID=1468449 RepID=UPI0036F26577
MCEIQIPYEKSGYYRMFMSQESYREACYSCSYASLQKPADITTGDYFEIKDDYPELLKDDDSISTTEGISCVITRTEKGEELLRKALDYIYLKEVDPYVVQASHGNLCHPSKHTKLRHKLIKLHDRKGYGSIERYYRTRRMRIKIIHTMKNILTGNSDKNSC